MPEFREYPKGGGRQIIEFNHVLGNIGTYGIYCVDVGIMQAIRHLLASRGLWRTSYVIEYSALGYTIPNNEEFLPVERAIAEFLDGGDMSCDIVSALNKIEDAIRAIKVCGSAPRQSTLGENGRWSGSTGVVHPTQTKFGQGELFSTKAEYDESRCNRANWLYEAFRQAVSNLSSLSLAQALLGTAGLAVISVAFLSNPPIAVLTGLAIAVGVSFALSQFCADFTEWLDDNREEFVCAIYSSGSAEVAYDLIDDLIDIGIAYVGVTVGNSALALVLMSFIDVDTISQAYAKGYLPGSTSPIPCTCGNNVSWVFGAGDLSLDGLTRTLESVETSGSKHTLQFTRPDCSYDMFGINIISHTNPLGQTRGLTVCVDGEPVTDHTEPFITGSFEISAMYFQADEEFSIQAELFPSS